MGNKILVVSNQAFSDSSSNGRTIKNLLLNIPKENIAQFYLHGEPDTEFCENYYQISDNDALRAFLGKKPNKQQTSPSSEASKIQQSSSGKTHKSYKNYVLRNIVWQSRRWWSKDFNRFLQDFHPDIVLLQAGDAPFMYDIARRIANMFDAKLMMYNSESYVLKKRMYESVKNPFFWHFWLMRSLKKQYRKFMNSADYCIYNTERLEYAYQECYPHNGKSAAIYTVSTMKRLQGADNFDIFNLLYCGNLGVGRSETLSEIADMLKEIAPNAVLDIYGKFPDDNAQKLVCAHTNVRYGGVVPYSEIPNLMSNAALLLHCENPEQTMGLLYAFSTKIADCLSSGIPFIVYASEDLPFVDYLRKSDAAHIANSSEKFAEIVKECISDEQYRTRHISNALALAAENHSIESGAVKMEQIIATIVGKAQ